jgi:hypothetical protein
MTPLQSLAAIVPMQCAIAAALTALLWCLYARLRRERYLFYWSLYWAVMAGYCVGLEALVLARQAGLSYEVLRVVFWTAEIPSLFQPALMVLAAVALRNRQPSVRIHVLAFGLTCAACLFLMALVSTVPGTTEKIGRLLTFRAVLNAGAIVLFAINFARDRDRTRGFAGKLTLFLCCVMRCIRCFSE